MFDTRRAMQSVIADLLVKNGVVS